MSLSFGSPAMIGQFSSIQTALDRIRACEWDDNGDGTGWFQDGHKFYNTGEAQMYRQNGYGLWGDIYTFDADMHTLNWTNWDGNGAVIEDDGYVTMSCTAGTDCDWTGGAGGRPRRAIALPPWNFMASCKVVNIETSNAYFKGAGIGVYKGSNRSKNYRSELFNDGSGWQAQRVYNGIEAGMTPIGASERWLSVSYRHNPASNVWSANQSDASAGRPLDSALFGSSLQQDVEQTDIGRWEGNRILFYARNLVGPDNPAFEVRFSNLYIYRL